MAITRRKFLKISAVTVIGTVGAGMGSLGYASEIEPEWVQTVRLDMHLPRLNSAFDGYKLAQISDLHVDIGSTGERLKDVVQMVNNLQPDAVAITGDFITHRANLERSVSVLVDALSGLQPKDVTVAVLGNHDHWTDANTVRGIFAQTGITDVNNKVHTLRRGDATLHLAGVDDYWERQDRLSDVIAALPDDNAAILLAHEPDYADLSAETGRFDLQISGHSHGGQVIMPFMNRPLVLPTFGKKYPVGKYQVGSMIQYTNRGIGMVNPAVRFNCRPEITLFTLRANA